MVTVTLHRWAGESTMTFATLAAAREHFNAHDVASDDTIDFVTARDGDDVYMLVDDNGYMWEPCSEGPY